MVNQQVLTGNWNEIKGKIRSHWGQLTDDDLTQFRGQVDSLVGTIQRKTGEGREAIERYLNEVSGSAALTFGEAAEARAKCATDGGRRAKHRQASGGPGAGRLRRGRTFCSRPAASRWRYVSCAGLVAGVLISMMLNSK